MKKLICVLVLIVLGSTGSFAHFENLGAYGSIGVSFGFFYSSLGSYGEWIPVDGHVYGWRPAGVAPGWRPYMYGRWAWTDDGWYWVSDEPWGWAVFHYGRWYYDDYYGWIWIPGYDWAPAWVEWRYGGPYVGWAPLSPYAVFSMGIGIHYRTHWVTPHHYWSFVDCRYISDPGLHRYVYRTQNNTRYFGRTRSGGSVGYDGGRIVTRGPERRYVEQRGSITVQRAEIVDARDRPRERVVGDGDRTRIEVYRPKIEEPSRGATAERPERLRNDDRQVSLETRDIDMRAREVAREEGRDLRRAEDLRTRETVRPDRRADDQERSAERAPREMRSAPRISKPGEVSPRPESREGPKEDRRREKGEYRPESAPRINRDAERKPEPRREAVERPRNRREEMRAPRGSARSENPERIIGRQENRFEQKRAEPERGGGRSGPAPRGERKSRER